MCLPSCQLILTIFRIEAFLHFVLQEQQHYATFNEDNNGNTGTHCSHRVDLNMNVNRGRGQGQKLHTIYNPPRSTDNYKIQMYSSKSVWPNERSSDMGAGSKLEMSRTAPTDPSLDFIKKSKKKTGNWTLKRVRRVRHRIDKVMYCTCFTEDVRRQDMMSCK